MPSVVGIMGHSVRTLEVVFKSLLSTEPWTRDPFTLPIPRRKFLEQKARCEDRTLPAFGYMDNGSIITPHPPISRAMKIVKKAMEEAGYGLVDWYPPSNNESRATHVHFSHPYLVSLLDADVTLGTHCSG
jgi:amidase